MNKLQFTLALGAMISVGFLFMDSPARKENRSAARLNSAQVAEAIFTINHLNSPMPWECEGFFDGPSD